LGCSIGPGFMHGLKLGSQGNRRMYSAKNALLQGTEVKYRGQRLDNNEERIVDCCKFRETLEEITIIIPVVTRAFREEVLGKSNSTWEAEDKCRYLSQPQACNRESHQAIVFPSRFIYLLAIYPSQYFIKMALSANDLLPFCCAVEEARCLFE
jgi:hypothetical protein